MSRQVAVVARVLVGLSAIVVVAQLAAQATSGSGPRPATSAQSAPRQAEPPKGQQPVVSFDVSVTLVEVDVVVTDGEGGLIRDLRPDEFKVFEDGVEQAIDRASLVEIPIPQRQENVTRAPVVATDAPTNQQRFEGRMYVLLLDDLNTATSRNERVKAAARRFIERNLYPGDVAAVAYPGRAGEGQGFTADKQLLLAAVARFSGQQVRSEALNTIDRYQEQQLLTGRTPEADQIRDLDEPNRAYNARVAFDTIAGIARQLEPVRGRRKALLWIGEGIPYDVFDARGRGQSTMVLQAERDAVAAAGRTNLAVYGVDARGLEGMSQETMQLTNANDPTTGFDASRLSRELARSQDNFRQVSADMGGFAVVNTEEFGTAFDRVVTDTSAYYLLGYYPKSQKAEGVYRSLEVRVSRPGAKVRARRGYTLLPGGKAAAAAPSMSNVPEVLRDAMSGPVPRSGLPMAVQAAPFKGKGDKASVLVTIEYAASAFEGRAGTADDKLQTSVVALDTAGKVQASDSAAVDLNVKVDTERVMSVLGFRTYARMDLPPGRYQLRVGAMVTSTGVNGSVYSDFDVPNFTARALQMSGVALTCVVGSFVPTAQVDERMRAVLPAPPTTMRDFRNDDRLDAFVEVYDGGAAPDRDLTFTTSIRRPDGQVVAKRDEARTRAQLQQSRGGYSVQVPLVGLAPGDYVLRIEAAAPGTPGASQDVPFHVWAVEGAAATPVASGAGGAPAAAAPAPNTVAVVSVAKGPMSGVAAPREVVARNDAEWKALWGTLPMKRAAPTVTFENTMVVAIFLGERPTPGYQVEITGLRTEGDTLVVEWRERVPDPGNPPTVTTPFAVAGVPMHAGPVRFERQ